MRFGIGTQVRRVIREMAGTDEWICSALTLPLGQISLGEARALGGLVAGLTEPGPIVEVGTLFGWSTRVMVLFKSPGRELITVDSYVWNPLLLPAETHTRATAASLQEAVERHGVRVVKEDKDTFYASYKGPPPSLVFLDAIHSYEETRKDIAWARAVHAQTICLHDYSPKHPGVMQAVDEVGGPRQLFESLAVL